MAKGQVREAGLTEPIVCALKRARNLESLPSLRSLLSIMITTHWLK
jgi:hypothetical protein